MDLIIKLFDVLFPVFLTIGIGYWYGKKDPKFDTRFITTFAGNFGLPAIIFYSFTTTNISIELFLRFSYYITLYVFIFSVIGEEFGFLGVILLLSIYLFILLRCFYLALSARDRFCRLVIGGLSLTFAANLIINLCMVVGLLPVVGMPLPFISKGGSSLMSLFLAFGIIVSMGTHKKFLPQ